MGKSSGKWKEKVSMDVVMNAINTMPISKLRPVAKIICGTDYAVRYYYNPKHPKFYKNEKAFRKALRRCISIGAFSHREIFIERLGLDEDNQIKKD